MQSSILLTLLRPAQDVTKLGTLTLFGAIKLYTVDAHASLVHQVHKRSRRMPVGRRQFASTRGNRNHLKDVKEYTASNAISIWQSTSNDPYENLAIENHLLKNSDPTSKILFTYVNRPSVVIGRNQNPWLECNLRRMQEGLPHDAPQKEEELIDDSNNDKGYTKRNGEYSPLVLVRRRSGGGTVIHDAGNLNFSFIVPNDKDFTRDKHAELVVSMLQRLRSDKSMRPYYRSVRVNERHDIVMKQCDTTGTESEKEFKVSGSAYKLTRGRALHHGTILHSSPNILKQTNIRPGERSVFSQVLSSPAQPYLEAKGVSSVRSPVHNLFEAYDPSDRSRYNRELQSELQDSFRRASVFKEIKVQEVGTADCAEHANKQIFDDIQELLTKEWQFCQTPIFEYSSSEIDGITIRFQVKHGVVGKPTVDNPSGEDILDATSLSKLEGTKLHEIDDWSEYIASSSRSIVSMISHLSSIFPSVDLKSYGRKRSVGTCKTGQLETQEIHHDGLIKKRSTDGSVDCEKQGENLVIER